MTPERDQYHAVLESLADGADIDWAALDAAATTNAERRRYQNLRLVARVAELHRTLDIDGDEPAAARTVEWDAVPASPPATWGHLTIGPRIAGGAYGQIYRAHDPQLSRDVALKLLRGDSAARQSVDHLLSEARTLARVHHPNVVTVHGADVRDGRPGLWMELLAGQTLEAWLQAHGGMGAGEAAAVGIDLCRALAAVHAAGLVHGDVKAQNVMRETGGRIVLMDFGAGRAQGGDDTAVTGTPLYLAPEVLAGEPPTPRSDIYSLGVLLFHLLSGGYPFSADDLDGLRAAHADGKRTWLRDSRPDLPDALVRVIERAVEADPARRYRSAGAMEAALRDAADGRAAVVSGETVVSRVLRMRRPFAAAAAVLLAVVVGLVVWSRRPAVPPSSIRSVAVLPMVHLSGATDAPHLADGLHDELITTLAQIQSLRVTSRSSVMQFKDTRIPAGELARKLGVDAVLESTVSSSSGGGDGAPGRVRVNASLVMAGESAPVWSRTFDRPLGDLLALEADVARAIAASVRASITQTESARLNRGDRTDPRAEEAYFQGRRHLEQYGSDHARRALDAFNLATRLDPGHAAAHAGAARAYISLGFNGDISQQEARASALAELQKTIRLDEALPEGRAALADIKFYYDWDWIGADFEYRRAIDLSPSFTYAKRRYASYLAAVERLDDAVQQASEAEVLDPLSAEAAVTHGLVLYYRRDYPAARAALERALRLQPASAQALILSGRVDEAEQQYDAALQKTAEALRLSGGGSIPLRVQVVRLEALAGRRETAMRKLEELQRAAEAGKLRIGPEHLAYAQIAFGNEARALDLLEAAMAEREPGLLWLAVDPRVDPLRTEARFAAVLRKLSLPKRPGGLP